MDALIYTAMSGAERALHAQQVHANNLANLDTGGFRANLELATSQAVPGYGYDARHVGQLQANALSTRPGAIKETGRDLDVAIAGDGFIAVQWQDGEAYTRAGALVVDAAGTLTVNGRPVLGDGGPIVLPEHKRVAIGVDGSVAIQPPGQQTMQTIDRIKLVKGEASELTKNQAGLIVTRNGNELAGRRHRRRTWRPSRRQQRLGSGRDGGHHGAESQLRDPDEAVQGYRHDGRSQATACSAPDTPQPNFPG